MCISYQSGELGCGITSATRTFLKNVRHLEYDICRYLPTGLDLEDVPNLGLLVLRSEYPVSRRKVRAGAWHTSNGSPYWKKALSSSLLPWTSNQHIWDDINNQDRPFAILVHMPYRSKLAPRHQISGPEAETREEVRPSYVCWDIDAATWFDADS